MFVTKKKSVDIGRYRQISELCGFTAKLRLRIGAVKHDSVKARRAPFYFARRLKLSEIQKLFTNDLKQRIDSIKTSEPSTLSRKSVKEVYRSAGDSVVGKPPKETSSMEHLRCLLLSLMSRSGKKKTKKKKNILNFVFSQNIDSLLYSLNYIA